MRHAAFRIFEEMFNKASQEPGPSLPTYFVPREIFHNECRKRGLAVPENIVEAWKWEESIGFPEFAHKIFKAYHKQHGTDFTPMEKGAWRLSRKQNL